MVKIPPLSEINSRIHRMFRVVFKNSDKIMINRFKEERKLS